MQLTANRISHVAKVALGFSEAGWIGIDVGTSSVKLAQVKMHGHRWELVNYQTIVFPEQGKDQDDDTDKPSPSVADNLVASLKENPRVFSLFQGRKAACVLPMSLADLQTLTIPDGNQHELQMMVNQELEMLSNGGQEEKEFTFWEERFSRYNPDGMIQAAVVTARKSDVLTIANSLLDASVHCHMMSAIPVAIARAIRLRELSGSSGVQAGFDWGTTSPMFTVVEDGHPVFSRVFRNCGFGNITRLLKVRMGLNRQESLHLLKTFQSPNNPAEMKSIENAISEMLVTPLKSLAREFRKTLEFIQQKRPDLVIEKMWLLGAGAGMSEVEALLHQITGIPTQVWTLPSDVQGLEKDSKLWQAQLGIAIALSTMAYDI